MEKRKIAEALAAHGGDAGTVAEVLQIPYKALVAKIRQYQLAS
jgi:transcriptional regulator with PAS, ATPase and Fis domain